MNTFILKSIIRRRSKRRINFKYNALRLGKKPLYILKLQQKNNEGYNKYVEEGGES